MNAILTALAFTVGAAAASIAGPIMGVASLLVAPNSIEHTLWLAGAGVTWVGGVFLIALAGRMWP